MRIDKTNTPYKLASDVAEIIKTLRITPHGVRKISPFEAHMSQKPNTPLSKIATSSTPNNLNWENAKCACLDRKNLTKPSLLHKWSEDDVSIKEKDTTSPRTPNKLHNSPTSQETGAGLKVINIAKDKLHVSYKAIQTTIDAQTKKRIEQVARKINRIATKVKNPKTFEQKYKTIEGKILTYTPRTACVQHSENNQGS